MAAYSYKALDTAGNISRGVIEGDSERQVRNQLRAQQLRPIEVTPARAGVARFSIGRFARRVALEDQVLFTRQLATLLLAGVPLDEALNAAARQSRQAAIQSLLLQIRSKVVAGQSLAASLAAFPQTFSPLYLALVRAGEQAGLLGKVLEQVADYLEQRQQLQHKMQMAMIYPCALILVAMAVIGVLMVWVLPDMADMFERSGASLPLLTTGLIALSRFIASWWWLLMGILLLLPPLLRPLLQRPAWRLRRDAALLRLPLVGNLLITADTARFASTLSLLTDSGVALIDALGISSDVMMNSALRRQTAAIAQQVGEGGSLARALDDCGYFPPVLTQMVASGENSGTLGVMLARAAQSQQRELEQTLHGLLKVLEPLLLVVMAVIVGTMVLAVLLPIMQMNTLVV